MISDLSPQKLFGTVEQHGLFVAKAQCAVSGAVLGCVVIECSPLIFRQAEYMFANNIGLYLTGATTDGGGEIV